MSDVFCAKQRRQTFHVGDGMCASIGLSGFVPAIQQEPLPLQDHCDATRKGRPDTSGDFAILVSIAADCYCDGKINVSSIWQQGHPERQACTGRLLGGKSKETGLH